MSNPKLKHVVFLVCVAVMAIGMIAMANAYTRPANPTMDYVPQNVGIYDTYYQNFKESDCRWCHGTSTADRHHDTWWALTGQCTHCHGPVIPNPPTSPAEKDCKVCHVDGGPIGNLGFPHHRSDLADAGTCIACHSPNLLSETNAVEPPQDPPTTTTPTPYSCENCHWPTGAAAHTAPPLADYNAWTGFPLPSHWPDGLVHPAPVEANGPMFSGNLWGGGLNNQRPTPWTMGAKAFQPMDGTHHEIAGKVYPKCYDCHGTNPNTDPSWDPNNVYLIRMCENCHDMGTLHAITEHTTDGIGGMGLGGYTLNGTGDSVVLQNNKCVACHGDNMPPMPEVPGALPDHILMRPWFGPAGITITLIPFMSTGGVGPYTLDTLGQDTPYNLIQVKQTLPAAGSFIDNPIASWSETIATMDLLGWTYQDGIAKVKVTQATSHDNPPTTGTSVAWGKGSQNFIVRSGNEISNTNLGAGNWGITLNIAGSGFLGGPNGYSPAVLEKIYPQEEVLGTGGNDDLVCDLGETCTAYGFSTYVELDISNDKYRATTLVAGTTDGLIKPKLEKGKLLDVNTGNPVPDGDLYQGDYDVYVITDYIKDNTVNGTPGQYNLGLGGLDPADELIYRDVSNAAQFTVTNNPVIQNFDPNPVAAGSTAMITGANFGVTGTEISGDGIGDDDGKCEAGEKCDVKLWNKLHTTFKYMKVKSWSNTAIKVKLGTMAAPWPKKKDVQVVVPGAPTPDSNFYRITIVKPGTY
jgi:hypothetical protein